MKHFSIDRFDGDLAICVGDDEEIVQIKRNKIPKDAREGDVLKLVDNIYEIDKEETKNRKEEIYNLQNELFLED